MFFEASFFVWIRFAIASAPRSPILLPSKLSVCRPVDYVVALAILPDPILLVSSLSELSKLALAVCGPLSADVGVYADRANFLHSRSTKTPVSLLKSNLRICKF